MWGLVNKGGTFKSGSNPHGTYDEFNKLDAARFLNLRPAVGGKYLISGMSTIHRLLLYTENWIRKLEEEENRENREDRGNSSMRSHA
ncbi:hypothetical protein PIB30_079978 [Stylosanthes scabra]|uniref:Uncharacterized protein n=1 Tax=Stylosanthes scabra TaxID=79078 RepID=A0ABU6UV03_9FABA|nr:hypothetical protein [Stylosanthes scabra]